MNEEENLNRIRQELITLLKTRQEVTAEIEKQKMNIDEGFMKNDDGQAIGNTQSKSNERGRSLTLTNGHPIGDNRSNGGFISALIISLLAGFAGGAIVTAIYIFINLGKVTVSL